MIFLDSWVSFLAHKDEAFSSFIKLLKKIINEKNTTIFSIRSEHGSEFDNYHFENFCNENVIEHIFFSLKNTSTKWGSKKKK